MKIIIAPYNPDWPVLFEQEKVAIGKALASQSPSIEHIGSTSITGLAAKPVVDILVGVKDDAELEEVKVPMMAAGFTYMRIYEPLMPYRRYFVRYKQKDVKPPALVDTGDASPSSLGFTSVTHIHILVKDTMHWYRHIAFRDYLREHPQVRMEYEQLKKKLSQQEFKDGLEYNDGKDSFIKKVEADALAWYHGRKQ
jgi:GrpB-like predicted nucleotidyltransferase (UPF0157 family)